MHEEKTWSVSDVNSAIRELIENSLMPFWLRGEVGTLNVHRSGHVYMTLKDERSQMRAVFFNGARQARSVNLRVGDQVEAFGKLTVYEVRGEYQFSIKQIRPVGVGDLQRRFEELKRKLEAEGLFAPERKKKIPLLPERIGVVTSPDGAAVRDFLQIIRRRFPNIGIMIYPAPVQGAGAAGKLAAGVEFFSRNRVADVIVLTRGGGSMEDLWPFNEETLARAVAAATIPVISAVGHEIDFTICDFVADLRVPTPSAAAELVVGRREEFEKQLAHADKYLRQAVRGHMLELHRRVDAAADSYVFREPSHMLRQKQQFLDELMKGCNILLERRLIQARNYRRLLQQRIRSAAPTAQLRECGLQLKNLRKEKSMLAVKYLSEKNALLNAFDDRLDALNPRRVLERGYAVVSDPENNRIITDHRQPPGKRLRATLASGTLDLLVDR